MELMRMERSSVIVTGGGSGIGKAMAMKFAEKGANVVITGRSAERLADAKKEIEQIATGKVLQFQMDVRNPERAIEMIEFTKDAFQKVDVLINNAAGNFICPAEDLSFNGWNSVIDIVLNGTWYCSQAAGKDWIANGTKGSILNIVATYAWGAGVGTIHSASAKAGVLTMTQTLAVEWGKKYGIRANAIAPGPIENTEGVARLVASEKARERAIESIPLSRFGKVEEIAHMAYLLSTPELSYINGECITMDGGKWLNTQTR